jgi:cation transport regulator ChaB
MGGAMGGPPTDVHIDAASGEVSIKKGPVSIKIAKYDPDSPPDKVKHLPAKAQRQWVHVYNSAVDDGADEESAHKQAWGTVPDKGKKNKEAFDQKRLEEESRRILDENEMWGDQGPQDEAKMRAAEDSIYDPDEYRLPQDFEEESGHGSDYFHQPLGENPDARKELADRIRMMMRSGYYKEALELQRKWEKASEFEGYWSGPQGEGPGRSYGNDPDKNLLQEAKQLGKEDFRKGLGAWRTFNTDEEQQAYLRGIEMAEKSDLAMTDSNPLEDWDDDRWDVLRASKTAESQEFKDFRSGNVPEIDDSRDEIFYETHDNFYAAPKNRRTPPTVDVTATVPEGQNARALAFAFQLYSSLEAEVSGQKVTIRGVSNPAAVLAELQSQGVEASISNPQEVAKSFYNNPYETYSKGEKVAVLGDVPNYNYYPNELTRKVEAQVVTKRDDRFVLYNNMWGEFEVWEDGIGKL